MWINGQLNGGLVGGGRGGTYQDGHSVLVSDILDIPILNNLIPDFSTDPISGIADFENKFSVT